MSLLVSFKSLLVENWWLDILFLWNSGKAQNSLFHNLSILSMLLFVLFSFLNCVSPTCEIFTFVLCLSFGEGNQTGCGVIFFGLAVVSLFKFYYPFPLQVIAKWFTFWELLFHFIFSSRLWRDYLILWIYPIKCWLVWWKWTWEMCFIAVNVWSNNQVVLDNIFNLINQMVICKLLFDFFLISFRLIFHWNV